MRSQLPILLCFCLSAKPFRKGEIFSVYSLQNNRTTGHRPVWPAGCGLLTPVIMSQLNHIHHVAVEVGLCPGLPQGAVYPSLRGSMQCRAVCVPTTIQTQAVWCQLQKLCSFFYFCLPFYWLGLNLTTQNRNSSLTKYRFTFLTQESCKSGQFRIDTSAPE